MKTARDMPPSVTTGHRRAINSLIAGMDATSQAWSGPADAAPAFGLVFCGRHHSPYLAGVGVSVALPSIPPFVSLQVDRVSGEPSRRASEDSCTVALFRQSVEVLAVPGPSGGRRSLDEEFCQLANQLEATPHAGRQLLLLCNAPHAGRRGTADVVRASTVFWRGYEARLAGCVLMTREAAWDPDRPFYVYNRRADDVASLMAILLPPFVSISVAVHQNHGVSDVKGHLGLRVSIGGMLLADLATACPPQVAGNGGTVCMGFHTPDVCASRGATIPLPGHRR